MRQRAEADKAFRFNNLFHFLKVDLLRASFYELNRKAAPGLDGVTWQVYEPIFIGYSYGSRPGRSPHDALDALHEGIIRRKVNWILDCDIEGFFDNLSHVHLLSFLEERVTDKRMLRLIRKWLRVGWVEDGKRHPGTIGTPQGSVISPLLANVFLNVVMDKWAADWRRVQAKGDVIIVRYVDDAVFGFQYEAEGRAFLEALRERLPRPRLVHPYPGIRFDAKYSR